MKNRPYVLTIAGFDPCGGAGVLADIKTFEQHKTLGLAVNTCLTFQTENEFFGIDWFTLNQLENQLMPLLKKYPVSAIKIGLIQKTQLLFLLAVLPKSIPIIWDPILKASAGFDFINGFTPQNIKDVLSQVFLITPNLLEFELLKLNLNKQTNVLLKGGHQENHKHDILIDAFGNEQLIEGVKFTKPYQKHGTGCVLSSAIAANLSLGFSTLESCTLAKEYVEKLLQSNNRLLGYHLQ